MRLFIGAIRSQMDLPDAQAFAVVGNEHGAIGAGIGPLVFRVAWIGQVDGRAVLDFHDHRIGGIGADRLETPHGLKRRGKIGIDFCFPREHLFEPSQSVSRVDFADADQGRLAIRQRQTLNLVAGPVPAQHVRKCNGEGRRNKTDSGWANAQQHGSAAGFLARSDGVGE